MVKRLFHTEDTEDQYLPLAPISKGSGKTIPEQFFVGKVNDGTIHVTRDGTVFNSTTKRFIGATGSGGYPKISMLSSEHGRVLNIQIHRLLWIVFKGDIPDCLELNHVDLNKENRRIDNLELITRQGNMEHVMSLGGIETLKGIKNHQHKLTDLQVVEARRLRSTGLPFRAIAEIYQVSHPTIMSAIKGDTWKHIGE